MYMRVSHNLIRRQSACNMWVQPQTCRSDWGIGHASISYLAGYPQSSYDTPHDINCSASYATKSIHDSAHFYGRVNGDSAGAYVPNIVGEEVAVAALKSLAQNKKISAICLEQHEKGLVPNYEAIRARVLKERRSVAG